MRSLRRAILSEFRVVGYPEVIPPTIADLVLRRSASNGVRLAMSTLLQMVVPDASQNLIGDNVYDSDRLDAELRFCGIELICSTSPERRNSTQDGRRLK